MSEIFVIELNATLKRKKILRNCRFVRCEKCEIKQCLENKFISNCELDKKNNYKESLNRQWTNSNINHILKRYDINNLIGYQNVDGIECYFLKFNQMQEKNNYFIKLLLLVDKDELDKSINIVYNRLNKIYYSYNITFNTNNKIKIYSPNYSKNNLLQNNNKPYIDVEIKKYGVIDRYIIGKSVTLLIVLLVALVVVDSSDDVGIANVVYSIVASVIFTVILEWIMKSIEVNNNRYVIEFGNMSTFIYEQAIDEKINPLILPTEEEVDNLEDPVEEAVVELEDPIEEE